MAEYVVHRNAVPGAVLDELRDAALQSSYVGHSPLTGTFLASRGFAITLKRDGFDELQQRFPFLARFVDLALTAKSAAPLWPWPQRAWRHLSTGAPNAFYLNLLLVPPGAEVGAHVDATLSSITAVDGLVPRLVSVLYLTASSDGGELTLTRDGAQVATIAPASGTLLHFRGDLAHAVGTVGGNDLRASLVLEQYVLPQAVLHGLAAFSVHSRGRFRACLEEVRQRPSKRFEVDFPIQRESDA